MSHVGQRVDARARGDDGDEPEKERRETVQVEPLPRRVDIGTGAHCHHEGQARDGHTGQGEQVQGRIDGRRGALRGQHGNGERRDDRTAQERQEQH